MGSLETISGLIIDMDGVLWHGDRAQVGLVEFFATLRELKLRFILATNNASLTAQQYVDKLAAMGVQVGIDEILTSGMATANYLAEQFVPQQTRVFVIGGIGARQPLQDLGFTLSDLYPDTPPHLVVCGLDKALSYDKLATATLCISQGAAFFATNADTTLPTERGLAIGNGSILAALTTATAVKPTVIGKPEPIIYQQAMAILGTPASETVAIGDRLDTDILGAVRTGIRSIMVLTGISSVSDIDGLDYAPTRIVEDIQTISQMLRG